MRTILKTDDAFDPRRIGAGIADEYLAEKGPSSLGRYRSDPKILFFVIIGTIVLMAALR